MVYVFDKCTTCRAEFTGSGPFMTFHTSNDDVCRLCRHCAEEILTASMVGRRLRREDPSAYYSMLAECLEGAEKEAQQEESQ